MENLVFFIENYTMFNCKKKNKKKFNLKDTDKLCDTFIIFMVHFLKFHSLYLSNRDHSIDQSNF